MNCEEFRTYLDNYETLTDFQKSEMESHAKECEKCHLELDFFLSMLETMRTLPKIEPPADFMDNLNIRLDREERKTAPLRAARHVRRNWRQYTALAACFALVAVITANRGILFDRIEGTKDGVITEETTKTGDNAAQTAKPELAATPAATLAETPKADETRQPDTQPAAAADAKPSAVGNSAAKDKENTASSAVTRNSQTSRRAAPSTALPRATAAAQQATSVSVPVQTAQAVQTPYVTKSVETVQTAQTETASRQTPTSNDYSLASNEGKQTEVAHVTSEENTTSETASSVEEIRDSYTIAERDDNLAMGRYYRLDKDGNPIEEDNEPKAIGSLSIASADAERAMEVIRQYPHSESGDMYTTDQTNFSLMLSMLSTEGISYTNYTPAGSGDVKFMVEFN